MKFTDTGNLEGMEACNQSQHLTVPYDVCGKTEHRVRYGALDSILERKAIFSCPYLLRARRKERGQVVCCHRYKREAIRYSERPTNVLRCSSSEMEDFEGCRK
eukprot:762419-Hanusia_phi.AAC.6